MKSEPARKSRGGRIYYPSAAGFPFSSAVRAGDFVFVSGQIAFLPDGSISTGSIEVQTRIVMESIKAILRKAGCGLEDVVRCGCTLRESRDFDAFNKTYGSYFPVDPPVRTTAFVRHVLNARVEIDCVAWRPLHESGRRAQ